MILKRVWQVVGVLLWFGGCAGDLRDPGRFAFLYDTDGGASGSGGSSGTLDAGSMTAGSTATPDPAPACVVAVFKAKCGSIGCHSSGGTQVDLVSANVERRLVDKPSSSTLLCKGRTLVATDGDSLLIDKITDPPPCGSPMPVTGSLTSDERSCLTDWVSSLAD